MKVIFRVQRFNPEKDATPYFREYEVSVKEEDRVLDGLRYIQDYLDGSLCFRYSCGHGICGSDAMNINGRNHLACKLLIKKERQPIVVRPLIGFPVIRDLVVNMEPFFSAYRSIYPYLIPGDEEPERERLQSPQERERFDDTTKCILCGACTSSCPSFWANQQYFGPAAIMIAHRFIFDSRDKAADLRLKILNSKFGIWRCRTIFNCWDACPRGIQITKNIKEIQKEILLRSL